MDNTPPSDITPGAKLTKLPFSKLVRPGLKAELAVAELAAASPPLTARHTVLLAGVVAFTAYPESRFARRVMQTKARDIYFRSCEALALVADVPANERSRDHPKVWPVSALKGFKKKIVDVLDGRDGFEQPRSKRELLSKIRSQSSDLEYAHHMMRIFHWLIDLRIAGTNGRPALGIERGGELAHVIGMPDDTGKYHRPSGRAFERRWEKVRKSIALSYAASSIHVPKAGPLIEVILNRPFGDAGIHNALPKLIARAKYVDETILKQLAPGTRTNRFMNFSHIQVVPQPFQPPEFDARALSHLRSAYS